MLRRLFGKDPKKKKRLSPSGNVTEGVTTPTGSKPHPGYQYALNEYAQTIAPATSNDDGLNMISLYPEEDFVPAGAAGGRKTGLADRGPTASSIRGDGDEETGANVMRTMSGEHTVEGNQGQASIAATSVAVAGSVTTVGQPQQQQQYYLAQQQPYTGATSIGEKPSGIASVPSYASSSQPELTNVRPASSDSGIETLTAFPSFSPTTESVYAQASLNHPKAMQGHGSTEPAMPDATYEEHYGDAYVGGPIKYVYPSGYQSMRPRGGPWKLSIAVCVSFTWLSIFIIGHCSDRIDQNFYQNEIDDDALVIETKWCGSRPLYLMWVVSMLITGLATAYCSVIGYIKVRDFSVANSRSQPPGMVGKSDYYIKIDDHGTAISDSDSSTKSSGKTQYYKKTIYQSDGTPQFWGGHIYRPTQAAVAITSR